MAPARRVCFFAHLMMLSAFSATNTAADDRLANAQSDQDNWLTYGAWLREPAFQRVARNRCQQREAPGAGVDLPNRRRRDLPDQSIGG